MNVKHDKEHMVDALLTWYDENSRILPWRSNPTPYNVWVSEIMLQQTRVEAVKPYFERFISTLPNLVSLAQASDDELHKLWEGLGYYNRVKNMKKCAQYCVEHYDAKLPSTAKQLKELPGIGDYTAGAIASIAFHEPCPAVDGNVLRVFSRLLVSEDDILKERTKRKFQTIIQDYIPNDRCADFTQALMEIGALICVPNALPRCNICPLASDCIGYQTHQEQRLPNKAKKKARRIEKKMILCIVCGNEVALHQRASNVLLADLYEFITMDEIIKRKDILAKYENLEIVKVKKMPASTHVFSHVEWHMQGYLLVVNKKEDGLWATRQAIEETYAIPTAFKAYKEFVFDWMDKNEKLD